MANSGFYLRNFRSGLAARLRESGHDVLCIADGGPEDAAHFARLGAGFRRWHVDAASMRPDRELLAFARLARILAIEEPDAALTFTIKPNLYVGWLARQRPLRYVPTLTGLGTAFLDGGPALALIRKALASALESSSEVFVQNEADAQLVHQRLAVPRSALRLVPGSGIELHHFESVQPPEADAGPRTLTFVGRLLRQKGALEFARAARLLGEQGAPVRCIAYGDEDAANRSRVRAAELRELSGGHLELRGFVEDARQAYAASHFVVLPSYREGLSRTLIEAAACGVPAITTNRPGCRDVVEHERTGYLCEAESTESLVRAMLRAATCSAEEHRALGRAARAGASRFAAPLVDERYLECLASSSSHS